MGDHFLSAPVALQFQWLSPTALFEPSYPNQQLHPRQPTVKGQDKKDCLWLSWPIEILSSNWKYPEVNVEWLVKENFLICGKKWRLRLRFNYIGLWDAQAGGAQCAKSDCASLTWCYSHLWTADKPVQLALFVLRMQRRPLPHTVHTWKKHEKRHSLLRKNTYNSWNKR